MTTLTEKTTQLENLLAAYDDACAKLQGIQAEREAVQEDHAATRDDDRLSTLERAKKTINLKSMVDILSSDESRQQKAVDALKAQVFELSAELFNIAGGAVGGAIHDRTQALLAQLREQYDVSSVLGLEQMLESHQTVRRLKEVQSGVGNYSMRDEVGKLHDARRFRVDFLEKLG